MSTDAIPAATSDLLLKVTPPRVPRHLIARASLAWQHPRFRDSPVVLVQAPAGFGKTSLLAQWRRECLAEGAAVAWVSAQSQDDMARFVQSLALAVRIGAGRPAFGYVLLQAAPRDGLEAATMWLAELAQSALNVVLFVDEAERLPPDAREALNYVLRNAPPNLRCVVAARPDSPLDLDDLVAYGQCTALAAEHLRFGLEETTALVRSRMGEGFDRDAAARLHEMSEGWPLGLQLTLSVMDGGAGGPRTELPRLDLHGGALREHFVGYLLANLAPPDLEFLTCVAVAAPLHPQLCAALLETSEAEAQLARLQRDTPVFVAGEQTEWVRMHSLVRGAMLRRFEALPAARQAALHGRAAEWLAGRGLLEAAARHALASGQPRQAYDMAERSLYESLMSQGRQGAVLEWLGWLPAEELDARPRLLLAATWSLALSEHHEEAERFVSRILAQPAVDDSLRCECAMILGGAAIFADDPDRFAELHDPWAEAPPLTDPKLLHVHANRTAFRALLDGEPALARLRQLQAPREGGAGSVYLQRWGDFHIAHAYLWEGQVMLAEKLLRPALAAADADLGRRSSFAAMLATLLAAALWERDLPEEAEAALANRLDVVERSGVCDSVLLAYRTLVGSSRVDLQACKLEYSIVSPK